MIPQRVDEAAGRWLRVTMAAGSLYDLVFAVVILFVPRLGAEFLEIPMPANEIYLRFLGVFLGMLALFYMLPVIHPGGYLGNVVVAIVGRSAGAIFLCGATLLYAQPVTFALLGLADLAFGVAHLVLLARAHGGNLLGHYLG